MEPEVVVQRPIIRDEELQRIEAIAKDEGGWAKDDEFDYNQKLQFSDDESEPSPPKEIAAPQVSKQQLQQQEQKRSVQVERQQQQQVQQQQQQHQQQQHQQQQQQHQQQHHQEEDKRMAWSREVEREQDWDSFVM